MTSKEAGNFENPEAKPLWIRLEYRGNFSSSIDLKPKLIEEIVKITKPKKPLVIKNGTETAEQTHIITFDFGKHFPFTMRKGILSFEELEECMVLCINQHVIDGKIQDQQRKENFLFVGYARRFISVLQSAVIDGIKIWAASSIENNWRGKQRKDKIKELDRFLKSVRF